MKIEYTGQKIRAMPNGSRTIGGFKFSKANGFTVEMTEEQWEALGREQRGLRVLTPEEEAAYDADLTDQEDGQEDVGSVEGNQVADSLVDDAPDDSPTS